MSQWVRLCALNEVPAPGTVTQLETNGVAVCLANVEGDLRALDNWCPHRRGPLGEGWVGRQRCCVPVARLGVR